MRVTRFLTAQITFNRIVLDPGVKVKYVLVKTVVRGERLFALTLFLEMSIGYTSTLRRINLDPCYFLSVEGLQAYQKLWQKSI
ncbi:MAG: hypothetical protein SAK29_15550 [Scytonema sp. PMC 1069.18]|nr:hypothetical protein [Scytonema sp. PMC 1069.18]MEC4885901.1 hypothetical protein [Scytonema sp. PMC 1070.18]